MLESTEAMPGRCDPFSCPDSHIGHGRDLASQPGVDREGASVMRGVIGDRSEDRHAGLATHHWPVWQRLSPLLVRLRRDDRLGVLDRLGEPGSGVREGRDFSDFALVPFKVQVKATRREGAVDKPFDGLRGVGPCCAVVKTPSTGV